MQVARRSWGIVAVGLLLTIVSTATAKYSGGTGEPNDPYQIATVADLIALGEDPNDYDKQFMLTADIDLDPKLPGRKVFDKAVIAPDTDSVKSGFQGTPFSGVFDGNGHTISHLTIAGKDYLGLLGQLGGGVKNVGVVDVNIAGSGYSVGGLVGHNVGTVTQCHSTGAISATGGWLMVGGLVGDNLGTMTQCYSTSAVSGGTGQHYSSVGGLVGNNSGTMTQCYSTGAVSGSGGVGALVGHNYGAVGQCYSIGAVSGTSRVVGGLVGSNGGPVTQCYSAGAVSGKDEVGGLVGHNDWNGSVTQCYRTGAVSGTGSAGGLVGSGSPSCVTASFWDAQTSGQTASAGGTGKTTAEMQTAKTFLDGGWAFVGETENGASKIWQVPQEGGYPVLAILSGYTPPQLKGLGAPDDPYLISNAAELGAMVHYSPAAHYRLVASIDLSGIRWCVAVIPSFAGTFDGSGHTISHLTIQGGSYLGLFGQLGLGAQVKNLGVADVNVVGSGSNVGGLVGQNSGIAVNCYSTGSVSGTGWGVGGLVGRNGGAVSQCYSTGTVSGAGDGVGGLVGSNGGAVTQSYGTGAVSGTGDGVGGLVGSNGGAVSQCYSTGTVSGAGDFVGGLVGSNGGAVTQSYGTGAVSGAGDFVGGLVGVNWDTVTRCYSTGAVSGTGYGVGGLVGSNGGAVTQSYGTGAVSGTGHWVGGLVGLNNADADADPPGSVAYCYSTGVVTGTGSDVGGLVGYNCGTVTACFWDIQTSGQAKSDGGTGKTTGEMQDPNTFMAAGWDFVGQADGPSDIWAAPQGGGYPILWWQLSPLPNLPRFSGGTGEPNDPYRISRAKDLNSMGHNPRLMKCHFRLGADLDLVGLRFYPIGDGDYPYGGVFDGNGHKVSHLTIKGDTYGGLFGVLGSGAEVKDLGVVDVNITGSGFYVGGLASGNGGSVTRCYSTGAVSSTGLGEYVGGLVGFNCGSVTQCHSSGGVSGGKYVGGLVGYNAATVTQCHSSGTVRGPGQMNSFVGGLVGYNQGGTGSVTDCYSTGAVSGSGLLSVFFGGAVGGLMGSNGGTVTQCYSTGAVSGTSYIGGLVGHIYGGAVMTQCYSTSAVTGTGCCVGGLVGSNPYSGAVTGCFWDTQTSGQTTSAVGTGKTTIEMQTAKTFLDAGWDFVGETANGTEDIWWINEEKDYPRLWWELIPEN